MSGFPVVIVAKGGAPFVSVQNGAPVATVAAQGVPISLVNSGAPPLVIEGLYTLYLGYAGSRYSKGGAYSSTPNSIVGYSYTRSGVGTASDTSGTISQFAANVPRITNKGVLIEEARTNALLRSQEFATTWGAAAATVSSNTDTAPDGTVTADQFLETAATSEHYVQQTPTGLPVNAPVTFTVYGKAIGGRFLNLQIFDAGAAGNFSTVTFDLTGAGSTSAVFNAGIAASASATIELVASGFYRCRITSTINSGGAGTSVIARIRSANALSTAGGAVSFAGDITKGLYLWGAQLEIGAFATSYIPTTTAAVTRAADALVYTGLNVAGDFTIYGTVELNAYSGATQRLFEFGDGTAANRILVQRTATGDLAAFHTVASVSTSYATVAKLGARTVKLAITRTGNLHTFYVDGVAIGSGTAAGAPTLTALHVGKDLAAGQHVNGYIKILAIDDRAFTEAEALAVTS